MTRRAALLFLLSGISFLAIISLAAARNNRFLPSPAETETLQKLVSDLQSQSKNDQIRAAQILGEMGSDAQFAVPALVKVIKTGSPEARVVSSIALLKIDPYMKDLIPILLRALEKQGEEQEAVLGRELGLQEDALSKWSTLMRSKVDPAILPLLVQALREEDKDIRILGVLVLGGVAVQLPEALPYVLKAYSDLDPEVRGAVVGALSRVGPGVAGVVPGILIGLRDSEPGVRVRTILALGRLGPKVPETVPALLGALDDKDPQVRVAALKVLESFGAAGREAVPAVAARAGRGDPEERLAAVAAAIRMDPTQSQRVTPLLIGFFKDPSLEKPLRLRAADLLESAGSAGREAASLTGLLADPDGEIRARVITLLAHVGPEASPVLSREMRNSDPATRSGAMQALVEMRPVPAELVPSLSGALRDRERSIRYLAAEGLSNLGVLAQAAIPALIQTLKDPEESVRTSAGDALLRMGEPAAAAIARAASDPGDPALQARASLLLKKVRHD